MDFRRESAPGNYQLYTINYTLLSHPDINLPPIQKKSDQPAEKHPGNGKQEGAEIKAGMPVDIVVEPGDHVGIRLGLDRKEDGGAHFRKQVNKERVFAEYGKELRPFRSAQKIHYVHDSCNDHAIEPNGINDKRTGPEFLVDRETEIPAIGNYDESKAQQE